MEKQSDDRGGKYVTLFLTLAELGFPGDVKLLFSIASKDNTVMNEHRLDRVQVCSYPGSDLYSVPG